MRKALKEIGNEERHLFTGIFERFGVKNGYRGPIETILILNVCTSDGSLVSDHLWFTKTKGFSNINLQQGDKISFSARVAKYEKGYKGYRQDVFYPVTFDYKLYYPTKIQKII